MTDYPYRKTFSFNGTRYSVYGQTLDEVAEKKAKKLLDLNNNTIIESPSMTVRDWSKIWLKIYKESSVSTTVYNDYQYRLNNFILPMIGNMKLKDVKVSHCNKILNDMAGFSKDRINKVQNCLKQMFEMAVIDDKLIKSPAMKLSPPKAVDGTHRSITPYERKITLQVANHHPAGSWVLTMLYCGLRPQETAALKGRHIDKKNMIIHIDQALKRDGIIDVTKTSAGRRIVPLHPELLKYFEKIDSDDFVFKSKKGKPLNNNNWGTMWKSFKREMQIVAGCEVYRNKLIPPFPIAEDLVPYCYRHTFATDLQDADIHINVAKDLIGHANISVTADIYTHMTEEQLQKSAQSIVKYSKKLQRRARHFRALNNTSIQRFKIGNISHV